MCSIGKSNCFLLDGLRSAYPILRLEGNSPKIRALQGRNRRSGHSLTTFLCHEFFFIILCLLKSPPPLTTALWHYMAAKADYDPALPSEALSPNSGLESLHHGTSTTASNYNLVQPSPVYHSERPIMRITLWALCSASRGSVCDLNNIMIHAF